MKHKPRFNTERIAADMAQRGWNNTDLANASGVSISAISRFMAGEVQTSKTAGLIALSLGHPVRRYFSHIEAVA